MNSTYLERIIHGRSVTYNGLLTHFCYNTKDLLELFLSKNISYQILCNIPKLKPPDFNKNWNTVRSE